jgi:aminoglycoside phosphotransferase (APT) family kinase protein
MTTATRDIERTAEQLSAWFTAQAGDGVTATVSDLSAPTTGGFSNETLFAQLTRSDEDAARHIVIRVEPAEAGLYPTYSVEMQYKIARALGAATDVPQPALLGYESDTSVLGTPFYAMERIDGRIPGDNPPFTLGGWVVDLSDEERATMYDNGLQILAQVAKVDWTQLDLGPLTADGAATDPLGAQIDFNRSYYEWAAENERSPTIEAAFDWLVENRPTEPEPVALSWGDSRMGNMIFREDLSIAAVLDWEMASLASPELDLGWWVFFDRYFSESIGAPLPSGFPTRDEVLARYEELTGHTPRHVDFYEKFAALRGAIIAHRLTQLMKDSGAISADSDMAVSNPAILHLAKAFDLPAPSDAQGSYIAKVD